MYDYFEKENGARLIMFSSMTSVMRHGAAGHRGGNPGMSAAGTKCNAPVESAACERVPGLRKPFVQANHATVRRMAICFAFLPDLAVLVPGFVAIAITITITINNTIKL